MTDGVYHPKFNNVSNLNDITKWKSFMADLKGDNADNAAVDLNYDNPDAAQQLSKWMSFNADGHYDDRTMAIIY